MNHHGWLGMGIFTLGALAGCGGTGADRGADRTAGASSDALSTTGALIGLGGKCLDVFGGATSDGATIGIWDCNSAAWQHWSSVGRTLVGVGKKCLDVNGNGTAAGTRVQLWTCNGGGSQDWVFADGELVNPESGKCLDVTGDQNADGATVEIWDCTGAPNQLWQLDGGASTTADAGAPVASPDAGAGAPEAGAPITVPFHASAVSPGFWSDVAAQPWGPAGSTYGEQLFWQDASIGASEWQGANQSAQSLEAAGIVPFLGMAQWLNSYQLSTGTGSMASTPGDEQWGAWTKAHHGLWAANPDGSSWSDSVGWISPATPLPQADWPAGVENASYADFVADRIGSLAQASGCRGFFAADAVNGLPGVFTESLDFNPAVLSAFAAWANVKLPTGSNLDQSNYILANLYPVWNDFWADRYAYFFGAMARSIERYTGQPALATAQIHITPAARREMGTDFRAFRKYLTPQEMTFLIELQSDGLRNVPPYGMSSAVMGDFAAREPDVVLGGQMSAGSSDFSSAIANTYPSLSAADQAEIGAKYLKNHWLEVGWTHILGRDGNVRRAPEYFARQYWDAGTVDPTLVAALQASYPVKPFGPAVYYSVPVERTFEAPGTQWAPENTLVAMRAKGAFAYYVSDATLDLVGGASTPTGWVVVNPERLSAAERAKLTSIAPIYDSTAASVSPVTYSAGVIGISFIDQTGAVVVTASNTTGQAVNATIHISGVPNGTYTARDMLGGSSLSFTVSGGSADVAVSLARWDTRAFSVAGMAP